MLRTLAFALLAAVFGVSLAAADEVKDTIHKTTGTVKSVSASSFVLTDGTGKDLTFEVDKNTVVYAKGASHKMEALKADGKPAVITEFLSPDKHVSVRYSKADDRMVAKDIKVTP